MKEIIEQIKKEIAEIKPGASEQSVKSSVKSILRNLNKLSLHSRQNSTVFTKMAADLSGLVSSQLSFYDLNKKTVVEKFDDSFFRALDILKKELFTLLAQASDETKH